MHCDAKIKNRIKRTSSQLSGILNMIDQERSCDEIVTQLLAVKSSVEKLIGIVTTNNLIQKVEHNYDITLEDVEKEIALIIKSK